MKIAIFGGSSPITEEEKYEISRFVVTHLKKEDWIITGGTTGVMEFVSKIASNIGATVEAKIEERWYEFLNPYNTVIKRVASSFQRICETLEEVEEIWVFNGKTGTLEELLATLNNTKKKIKIIGRNTQKILEFLISENMIDEKLLGNVEWIKL